MTNPRPPLLCESMSLTWCPLPLEICKPLPQFEIVPFCTVAPEPVTLIPIAAELHVSVLPPMLSDPGPWTVSAGLFAGQARLAVNASAVLITAPHTTAACAVEKLPATMHRMTAKRDFIHVANLLSMGCWLLEHSVAG